MKTTRRERPGAPFPDETADLPVEDVVAAVDPLAPGQRIGRFVIRARLGEGGMGIVVAAHDPDLDRPVAMKLVRDDRHPRHAERLRREARALARIEHPNVVRVYEVGSDRGRLFLAMELVDGATLTDWLAAQRRTWREIVMMFVRVADGLAAVHRGGIVHRDFKPDNVLVDRAGTPRVADFGLARLDDVGTAPAPEVVALTRTGVRIGTPGYMAPEQMIGAEVDGRADQYSFCVALGEAVFGREGREREDTAPRRGPAALRALVERGLAADPTARFASMDDVAIALRRITRHTRTIVVSVAIAAVAAGATAAAILVSAPSEQHTTRPAQSTTPTLDASRGPQATTSAQPTAPTVASPTVAPPISASTTASPTAAPPAGAPTTGAPTSNSTQPGSPQAATPTTASPTTASPTTAAPPSAASPTVKLAKAPTPARHPDAVREATRLLGYGGVHFTGSDFDAEAEAARAEVAAATTDLERGRQLYGLATVERRRGDCDAAVTAANDALVALSKAASDATQIDPQARWIAWRFITRARVVLGLCALESGRIEEAKRIFDTRVAYYFDHVEGAERVFAVGIVAAELGETDRALQLFHGILNSGDEVTRALGPRLEAYALAAGISDAKHD